MKTYTLAIIGSGALATIIGKIVSQELSDNYKILGVFSGTLKNAKKLADEIGCKAYKTLEDILGDTPDYVIEAASPDVFKDIGVKILANGIHIIPLSVGALADQEFYDTVRRTALQNSSRVHIPSGAVGGFDVLRSAMLMGEVDVSMTTEKSPESLNGAPFLKGRTLSENQSEAIFNGSAREAIEHFPKNVNVAVATAMATTGVENTKIAIHSIAGFKSNRHTIKLTGTTINVEIMIETTPSQDNPKSSALAAYSVIGLLKNLVAPIAF